MPSWQWLQKRRLVNTTATTRTLGFATQVTRLILQPNLTNRRERISFSTNLESCRRFVNKIRWGIRQKPVSNKLHTLTMSTLEKRGSREGAIQRESESRIGDKFGPSWAADLPSWRFDSSSFKTTMSFFLKRHYIAIYYFLLIQQYSYYHKLPLIGRFLVFWQAERRIHSAQRQQQMWSTELGVFSKFASNIVFRSGSSGFLGTWTSVRTVSASLLASTITSSGVLVLLTGSPVATTPSCLDLTIRFLQLGCEAPFSQNWGYDNNNKLCPLVCLIVRVIGHMKLCRAQGTLVLPPNGSQLFSGMPLIEMECTGIALLSFGYIYLSSGGY